MLRSDQRSASRVLRADARRDSAALTRRRRIFGSAPPGTPGAAENAQWLITNNTFNAPINQVHTRFSGRSIDQWCPDDKLNVNLGLRVEDFQYLFGDTMADSPARQFGSRTTTKILDGSARHRSSNPGNGQLYGRLSYRLSRRGDDGRRVGPSTPQYQRRQHLHDGALPAASRRDLHVEPAHGSARFVRHLCASAELPWVQYNVTQQDLPTTLGSHFYSFGFNTPEHTFRPDVYNYDLSWEQRLKGTDWSFKLTPVLPQHARPAAEFLHRSAGRLGNPASTSDTRRRTARSLPCRRGTLHATGSRGSSHTRTRTPAFNTRTSRV